MKSLTLTFIICLLIPISGWSQTDSTAEANTHFFIGLEILKPLTWILDGSSYVVEPEITYQRKHLLWKLSVGHSSIDKQIYHELIYSSKGYFIKAGMGMELDYFSKHNSQNSIIYGVNLIFSSNDEKGIVDFNGDYFEDYSHRIDQHNNSKGVEVYFTNRTLISEKAFISFSARIAYIVNAHQQEEFPVYYAPGFGVVNLFGSENQDNNNQFSGGLSIKIGYRFKSLK